MNNPTMPPEMEELVQQAVALEEAAKAEAAKNTWQSLTIRFKKPFVLEARSPETDALETRTFETLTFDWTRLTGKDSLDVEAEVRALTGRAVVNATFDSTYLMCMAVRACTSVSAEGKPFDRFAMQALPIAIFQKICTHARNFFVIAEFVSVMEAGGSENDS